MMVFICIFTLLTTTLTTVSVCSRQHWSVVSIIMDNIRLTLISIIISNNHQIRAFSSSINNLNSVYSSDDYVDIDEGALVKVEFSKTLR